MQGKLVVTFLDVFQGKLRKVEGVVKIEEPTLYDRRWKVRYCKERRNTQPVREL